LDVRAPSEFLEGLLRSALPSPCLLINLTLFWEETSRRMRKDSKRYEWRHQQELDGL
jgi:hypothetical protein